MYMYMYMYMYIYIYKNFEATNNVLDAKMVLTQQLIRTNYNYKRTKALKSSKI